MLIRKETMSQPRRALSASSGLAEDAVATPQRVAQRAAGRTRFPLGNTKLSFGNWALPAGIAAPIAGVLAVSIISTAAGTPLAAVSADGPATGDISSRVAARGDSAPDGNAPGISEDAIVGPREEKIISRDMTRPEPVKTVVVEQLKAVGTRYPTADLIIRQTPAKNGQNLGTLTAGSEIKITGSVVAGYRQIIHKLGAAWVLDKSLTAKKPVVAPTTGGSSSGGVVGGSVTQAPCPLGSAVENGLRTNTIKVYRSVCANFPQIKSYGGVRADSMPYHPSGRALDIMLPSVSQNALGWQIARWVVANASQFNIDHVIFDQQIWIPGSGWRGMEDRGGATANHRDHVHVSVK
jgi:hypothetical protein